MGMERVTVEQNGERFTLEVPEGTTDDQVKSFITQQQSGTVGGELTQPEPSPAEHVAAQAPMAAIAPTVDYLKATNGGLVADAAKVGGILYNNLTPGHVADFLKAPVKNTLGAASAYLEGLPFANKSISQMAPAIGKSIGAGLMGPENMFTAPYNMAAYEQEKIRANPNAPGLEYNPYAQTVRGQAATQGQAGAANQMRTVANQPYGNVNPQERAILEQDRMMRQNIRKKAYEKVMGPVVPGSM